MVVSIGIPPGSSQITATFFWFAENIKDQHPLGPWVPWAMAATGHESDVIVVGAGISRLVEWMTGLDMSMSP